MIKRFPIFLPLELSDRKYYERKFKKLGVHADFHFYNLEVWLNQDKQLRVSELNGNVIFRFDNPFRCFRESYTMIGTHKLDKTFDELFNYLRKRRKKIQLALIQDFVIKGLKQAEKYIITLDESNSDYVLDANMLAEMKGSDYALLRKHFRQFERLNKNIRFDKVDLTGREALKLINYLHTWDRAYSLTRNDSLRSEGVALSSGLINVEHNESHCYTLTVNGSVEAFVIFHVSPFKKNYYVINHLKCSYSSPHMFDYVLLRLARQLRDPSKTVEFNMEQDLGIEGLRIHKQRLRPKKMLPKYYIEPKRT